MDSLKKKINNIQTVRHIQRGTFTPSATEVEITLSGFKDVNKMVVLLNGSNYDYYYSSKSNVGYGYNLDSIVSSLTTNKLTVTCPRQDVDEVRSISHSYQVIEFY